MNSGADEPGPPDTRRSSAPGSSDQPGAAVDSGALSRFGAQAVVRLRAGFARSRHPMLIADDHRRWVTGNDAACELLGIGREAIPWQTMDDVTPPSGRRKLTEQWRPFLDSGAAEGWYQLEVQDRGSVPVEFSAIANVVAGRHLMVFAPPDDASVAQGQLGSAREAAWAPVATPGASRAQLTKRETEVMTMIAAGGHSDDIAAQLFLSSETIKSHAQNAMVKLGAHTRAHAVAIALVTGKIMWSIYDSRSSAQEPPHAS
jgi:DNA-binding CsgD family transcriptional regulator